MNHREPAATANAVPMTGESLDPATLADIGRRGRGVSVPAEAFERVRAGHQHLRHARENGSVYGANTGVGANRDSSVGEDSDMSHARRLLRSHCAAAGELVDEDIARAAMAVRLNQLLIGNSGVAPAMPQGLADALNAGATPTLHRRGAIGTADLAQLAELGLTLVGERPWKRHGIAPVELDETDALPFMSSSAVTLATAALAVHDVGVLLRAAEVVAALTFLALVGSREAWDPRVHRARSHPAQEEIAVRLTRLLEPTGATRAPTAARTQDPFGLRTAPVVQAPAVDAVQRLRAVIEREINSASENPLIFEEAVLHHGQSHLATLSARLDETRTAMLPVLGLSSSRLSSLMDPHVSGLSPFLSDDVPGSSGLMIGEYVAQDALATARTLATPVSGATVSISMGVEDHASFATHGARQLNGMLESARIVVALEALAATRALRIAPARAYECPARRAYELVSAATAAELADRSLGDDLHHVVGLLGTLAEVSH